MNAPTTMTYPRKIPKVGETAQVRKTMTVADQGLYSGISGNIHPLYVNEVHAQQTSVGTRLMFELAVASLLTNSLTEVGGAFCRVSAMNLTFPNPTRIGDTVAARVEVTAVVGDRVTCKVSCKRDEGGLVVCEGTAELVEVK
ncbi:MAG: acyl dehydratase [Rhodospirillales bacterium]|nr:acyl dehydratase [Rhodospirillales bacterium]